MGGRVTKESNEPNAITGLTPKQVTLLLNSWAEMKKDMVNSGIGIFIEFFKMYPIRKEMFSIKHLSNEELKTDGRFRAHIIAVMYAFSSLFENIDNPEMFVYLLQKNGVGHIHRQIPAEAYYELIETLVVVLTHGLGDKFTPELQEAWRKMLTYAFDIITEFSRDMPKERFDRRTKELLKQENEQN